MTSRHKADLRTFVVGQRVHLSPDRIQGRTTDPVGWIIDSIDGRFAKLRHVDGGDWREPVRLSDLIADECPRCHGAGYYPIDVGPGVTHGLQRCSTDCIDRAIAAAQEGK